MGNGKGIAPSYSSSTTLAHPQAYLQAWAYAQSFPAFQEPLTETQKALSKFIQNWTCSEFVGFVEHCRDVVDGLELEKDPDLAKRCEQVSDCEGVVGKTVLLVVGVVLMPLLDFQEGSVPGTTLLARRRVDVE